MTYPLGRAARAAAVLAAGLLLAATVAGSSARRRPRFPAPPGQTLSGAALEAALHSTEARVEKDPDDLAARVDLGLLYAQRGGKWDVEAINALETARDLGAADPEIPYALGVLYQAEGLHAFALREFQRFLRTHPSHKEAGLLLAKLLYQSGRLREAAERYEDLRARYPRDPVVAENYGLSLLALRDLSGARAVFAALRERGGEPARRAQYFLGNAALSASDYKEALRSYAAALPAGGEPPAGLSAAQVYAGVALACEGLGRRALAISAWSRVLAADPGHLQAQARLIELRSPRAQKGALALKPGKSPKG